MEGCILDEIIFHSLKSLGTILFEPVPVYFYWNFF